MVAADGFYLHSAEAESAVAFDCDDRLADDDGRAYGISHADAYHTPRSAVETFARLVHVDDVATEIEGVHPFIDNVRVRLLGQDVADRAKCAVEVHRVGIGVEVDRHARGIVLLALGDRVKPRGRRADFF